MYFNKIRHPANFTFAEAPGVGATLAAGRGNWRFSAEHLGDDVHRIQIVPTTGWVNPSQAELNAPSGPGGSQVTWDERGFRVQETAGGRILLEGIPGATFGVSGEAWMMQFRHHSSMQFFGLGEHSAGWEKTGQRVKFWNADMWADHSMDEIRTGTPNPMYVSIPWLIVKQDDHFLGILVHHPGAVFMDLASSFIWSPENHEDRARQSFFIGAPDGGAELYVIVGPSLADLTCKLQRLVGVTPRPPLWALGHHQCRWGYGSPEDLEYLDSEYTRHEIPTDGLWLDIDYMDRYKVFTWSDSLWGGEDRVRQKLSELANRGRRVVPILDPGVKASADFELARDGVDKGIFCLNREGRPCVGFVWPGPTYFPDFSLPEARTWWALRVRDFARLGVAGAWLDMNDPSLGAVEVDDLLFDRGQQPHASFHNQYAWGMAKASHEGFLAARPDERPFLLTRSASVGVSRYAAVWTGDNFSNWHHLRASIPLSLGLALSGQPFNGPDVPGFGDDATPELAVAWYKAGFLFPFFRNHSTHTSRRQEPWALGPAALKVSRKFIRLRYRFLPYLYQLFVQQERSGEAILRPLMYHYGDDARHRTSLMQDQFLVGRDILQAPLVEEGAVSREVFLPGSHGWFGAHDGRWREGGRRFKVRSGKMDTPIWFREGALVPHQPDPAAEKPLHEVELLIFLRPGRAQSSAYSYVADDGHTMDYRAGRETRVEWSAWAEGRVLHFRVLAPADHCGSMRVRPVVFAPFTKVVVHGEGCETVVPFKRGTMELSGRRLPCWRASAVSVG